MKKIKCPKCGGHLVYETFGQYGLVSKIGYNGKIQKRTKRVDYGCDGAMYSMVYCPKCSWDSDGRFFHLDGEIVTDEVGE